jgi:hypothetical protein
MKVSIGERSYEFKPNPKYVRMNAQTAAYK